MTPELVFGLVGLLIGILSVGAVLNGAPAAD